MTNGQNGDDRLLDYLYGEMSPEERQAFEAELANDPALRQTYDRYRDVTTAYEQLEPVEPPRSSYYDILREARRAVSPIESSEPSMMQRILSLFRSPGVAVALTLTIVVGTSVIFMKRSTIETEGERQDRRYVREREEGVKEKPRTPYTKGSDDGPRARVPYTKSGTDGVERPLTETTKLKAPESPAPTGGPKKKSDLLGSDVGRGGRSNKTGLNVESPTKGLKPQRSPDPKDGESLDLPGREGKKKRGHFEEKPKLGTRPGYLQDERDRTVKKPQKEPAPKQDPTPVVPNPTPTLAPPPRPSVVPAPTPTPKPALVVKRTLRPSGNKGSRRGDTTKRPTMVGDTTPPRRDYDKRPPVKARKKAKRKGSVTLDSLSQVETGKHRTTIDNAPRKKVRLKSKAGIKRETGFGLLGGAKRPQRRFYYRAPSIRPSRQRNEKESQNQRGPGPKGVVTSKKPTTVTKLQTHNAPETPRDVKRGKTAPDSSTTLKDPRKRRIEPNSKSLQPTLPQPRPKKAPSVSDKKSQKDFKSGKDFKSKVSKSPKEDREVRRPIVLDDQIRRKGDQILDRRRGHGKLTKQVPRNDLPRKRLPPSNKVTPKVVVRLAKTKSGRVDDRPGGERNKRERTTVISRLSFARAQARSGKLRLAVNEYRRVIAKTSGAARQQAQFELALLYLRLGWNAQATRLLVALKRSPRYATAATAMLNRLAQKSIVKRRVTAKKSKAAKRPVRRPKQKSDTSRTVK